MNLRVIGARQRIDNLLAKTKQEPLSSDDELKAEIARLLCVLCSGFIEDSLRLMLADYSSARSAPRVATYVSTRLGDFQNPKFEKILALLQSFDPTWRQHFEESDKAEMKAAIDSIVVNRHLIAHGRPCGISIGTFDAYYKQVRMFIDDIDMVLS